MKRSLDQSTASVKRQAVIGTDGTVKSTLAFPPNTGISQEIKDRGSVFQGYFVPVFNGQDAAAFIKSFRASPICDAVDHAMSAFRYQAESVDIGHDDDGERFSGKRMEDLLTSLNAFGLVIVIRQYGGIMLGPIRFQHILQCAREAYMAYKANRSRDTSERDRLLRLLTARDRTISMLRTKLEDTPTLSQESQSGREYTQDTVTLKRLLNARDRTIETLRLKLSGQASQS